MKIRNLFRATIAAVLIGLVAMNSQAQPAAGSDRLNVINEKLGTLLTQMEERTKTHPQLIEDLREHRVGIEKAAEEIQSLLDFLRKTTDDMDVNSEYRKELAGYENLTANLIAELKAKDDPILERPIKDLNTALENLRSLERRRAATVIQARNAIRSLEDNQELLEVFKKVNHIQAAVELFERSQGEFENIVGTAQEIQAGVAEVVSTP